MNAERDDGSPSLEERCRLVVERLSGSYDWQLAPSAREQLVAAIARAHAPDGAPTTRTLEQTCCRLHFASLRHALGREDEAEAALAELFSVRWPADGSNAPVRYGGYLFRGALATLRRRLSASGVSVAELEQTAADAAARALAAARLRFGDCRDPDAFWGWLSRVTERAAIDELRAGGLSGGRSVHAASLDAIQEAAGDRVLLDSARVDDEREVDALAVREELLRKCRLGKLSDDQREALVRCFWGGEQPREIAVALTGERGYTVTAAQVSLWKHRGLQVMEANLRGRGYD